MKKSVLLQSMGEGEFSICEFFVSGAYAFVEPRWCDAKSAVALSKRLIDRNDTTVQRIIIVDSGDCTVFEWQRGKGITLPVTAG
jgi:archaellum biogenesis ATPase FlaH